MNISLIDICPRERWRAKSPGGRYSISVLVAPARLPELSAVLELSDGPTCGPTDQPPAGPRPTAPKPALATAITPMGEAGPPIAADQVAPGAFSAQYARAREDLTDASMADFAAVRARDQGEAGPMAGHGARFMVGPPIDSPSPMPREFFQSIKSDALIGPNLTKPNLWSGLADLNKLEVRADLEAHPFWTTGGIMPAELVALVRFQQRAGGISQERLAQLMGLSRPQLANVLQGRFGLSPAAAARLLEALTALPIRAPDLFDLAPQHEASP